jgi:hypothetical protein
MCYVMVNCGMVWYRMVKYGMVRYGMIWYSKVYIKYMFNDDMVRYGME